MARIPKDYKPEFNELGVDRVRRELLARRWDPEKLSAARLWVESQDAHSWVAGRGKAPPDAKKKKMRSWAIYIATAFGFAYVATRVIRQMF